MKKRTLYLTDLDGTLLRGDQTVSIFTAQTISNLIRRGLLFSYATARSYTTASKITANLPQQLPVIVFNGSFIVDPRTEKRLLSNVFSSKEAAAILDTLTEAEIFPIVNAFFGNREKFSYVRGRESRGVLAYLEQRSDDVRKNPVHGKEALYGGEIFHVTCIDEEEKLRSAYGVFKNTFPCVLYRDTYTDETWLEIHPAGATKAEAAKRLKALLDCDRIVCFGDGINDIPLFEIADECYAVANAQDELKAYASAVIEGNEDDGVARWLEKNAKI